MKNQEFLKELKERLVKEFNYHYDNNYGEVRFYNQELNNKNELGFTILNGLVAHLTETYRHNATKENISCEVSFIKWNNNGGQSLGWFKIRQDASEKQISNFIKKVVKRYNELMEEGGK